MFAEKYLQMSSDFDNASTGCNIFKTTIGIDLKTFLIDAIAKLCLPMLQFIIVHVLPLFNTFLKII